MSLKVLSEIANEEEGKGGEVVELSSTAQLITFYPHQPQEATRERQESQDKALDNNRAQFILGTARCGELCLVPLKSS